MRVRTGLEVTDGSAGFPGPLIVPEALAYGVQTRESGFGIINGMGGGFGWIWMGLKSLKWQARLRGCSCCFVYGFSESM